MIAALYVDPKGVYAGLPDVDLWDEALDRGPLDRSRGSGARVMLMRCENCGRKDIDWIDVYIRGRIENWCLPCADEDFTPSSPPAWSCPNCTPNGKALALAEIAQR